ncbi:MULTISPECIES: hypothetical protein [unclassified Paenibacillus]|nr:hypothetical protein [Paenibacillus sp. UASWS1643]
MNGYNPGMSDKAWRKVHEMAILLNRKYWKEIQAEREKELKKNA